MYNQTKKRRILALFFFMASILLSGCLNSASTTNDIYEKLEKVVTLEEDFENQQQPLVELEKREKDIYNEIMDLGMKDFEQIVKLSGEAIAVVDKRKEHLNIEEASIQASKKEFETLLPLIEKIDDVEMKEKANELYHVMMDRYSSHSELYQNYIDGLERDKELYQLFQKEDLAKEELEEQINRINETYEKVLESNKNFNELTIQYNDLKLQFYEVAGIEMEKKDNKD